MPSEEDRAADAPSTDFAMPRYHGSPLRLEVLRAGSTLTQDRDLARVFSHRPTFVCISDEDATPLKHNGKTPGFLYRIAQSIGPEDIYPHPQTVMSPGKEWLTKRELRLMLVGPTEAVAEELLDEDEIAALRAKLRARGG